MKPIQLDDREEYILSKAKELDRLGIKNYEIDSLFLFDFDARWHSKLAKARREILTRDGPFDPIDPTDLEFGRLLEMGAKELRYAFRFELDGVEYIGRRKRDEIERMKIDGKIYDCTEVDVSIPLWLSGAEKEMLDWLERTSPTDDRAKKLLENVKENATKVAHICIDLSQWAMFYLLDYFVSDEDAIRAAIWGARPEILGTDNYLLVESATRPASITIFNYDLNDSFPSISESKTGFKLRKIYEPNNQASFPPRPFTPGVPFVPNRQTMRAFLSQMYERQKRNKPKSPSVRIRTWAIYRLSKRGGGTRSEPTALQIWADHDQGGIEIGDTEVKVFQRDRDALFLTDTVQQQIKRMQESAEI